MGLDEAGWEAGWGLKSLKAKIPLSEGVSFFKHSVLSIKKKKLFWAVSSYPSSIKEVFFQEYISFLDSL